MEDVQIQVESLLRRCSSVELEKIAVEIKIAAATVHDKTKVEVMRAINEAVDELGDDDQKKEVMKRMIPAAPDKIAQQLLAALLGKSEEVAPKVGEADSLLKALQVDSSSRFRKEFKIDGKLDDSKEDSLGYISLCKEVADGRKKGFKDEEIAIAVRRCAAQGSKLRAYFDTSIDLPLNEMMLFIRDARNEKSASELHQEMTKAFQTESMEAVPFAIDLMQLSKKIILAATAEGSIQYTEEQVREEFLHSLRTGLRDVSVKTQIEPLITRGAKITDNEIIKKLRVIASEEAERAAKRDQTEGTPRKNATVNQTSAIVDSGLGEVVRELIEEVRCLRVEVCMIKSGEETMRVETENHPVIPTKICNGNQSTTSGVEESLVEIVKQLKDEVGNLRVEVNNLKNKPPFRRGCKHCQQNNKGNSCRHCWKCGAGDHKRENCTKEPLNG